MTDAAQTLQPEGAPEIKSEKTQSTFSRVAKYTLVRMVALFITVIIGIYLTILIANMGGYVDRIRSGQVREQISAAYGQDPTVRAMAREDRDRFLADLIATEEERLGLNRPFVIRSFNFLTNALTLNLGRATQMSSDSGSGFVRLIILERLPPTLVLFASANLLLFFSSVFIALYLSRRYGSFFDKVVVSLAPTSAAPAWLYGLFFIVIFAALLRVLPFGGMVQAPPPPNPVDYALSMLRHMILPVTAILVGGIFLSAYSWRTFFLISSSEDYVDMAKAKGLSSGDIERRYVLRPTLPTIITSFALNLIFLWQGSIILETVFNWPGLGRAYFQAIGFFDTPVIVGITVIYAYLLAITVFLLDFIYALVDPRIKIGEGARS
jgi:peptide/nickel transport system permease protein